MKGETYLIEGFIADPKGYFYAPYIPVMEKLEKPKANWEPFYGKNNVNIGNPEILCFGSVSFIKHIGKPLSQDLWEDLMYRFLIKGLNIYRPGDCVSYVQRGGVHCEVFLDDKDNVKDIQIVP